MLRRRVIAAVWVGWLLMFATLGVSVLLEDRLVDLGRSDLTGLGPSAVPFVLGIFTAMSVGAVLVIRGGRNPVGWLFPGFGDLIALGSVATDYAAYGANVSPVVEPG